MPDVIDDFDQTEPTDEAPPAPKPDEENDVAKWKALARKHERESAKSARELEQLRNAQLSDNERAINEAKAAGRSEAMLEAGVRMVDSEVRAAAAGRDVDIKALLEGLDRKRFLDEDGNPDSDRIVKFVDKIAPPRERIPPGRGGPRSTADRPNDMNALIRRRAGATSE